MNTSEKTLKSYKGHGVSLLHHWRLHGYELQLRPVRKVLNILRALFEWKTRKAEVKSRPCIVRLNTSAVCNLNCPACLKKESFNLAPGQSREPYLMSLNTFDRVLSGAGANAQRMTFHITGEPMMNPRLFEMIKRAHEQKVVTYFSTNFNLVTRAILPKLFESGLDKIRICLDGFSQETYGKYRVGGSVEKVKQGISMVMEEKRRRGASRPMVQVLVITFNHVKPELEKIKTFCHEQGVDQVLMIPDGCNVDGSHVATIQGKPYAGCFWPWVSMVVDADGSVYTCGESFDGRLPYGNVNKDTIDSIWNNEVYTETRRFLSGKSAKREDLKLPCYDCGEHFGTRGTIHLSEDIPMFSRTPEQLRGRQPLGSPESLER